MSIFVDKVVAEFESFYDLIKDHMKPGHTYICESELFGSSYKVVAEFSRNNFKFHGVYSNGKRTYVEAYSKDPHVAIMMGMYGLSELD